ncbi:MAG: helix-turn-helix domain-containing protein [Opitutales bacterium]
MKDQKPTAGQSPILPTLLTAAQTRRALGGIARATEHRWMRRGLLVPIYIGGKKLYRESDVIALIEQSGGAR